MHIYHSISTFRLMLRLQNSCISASCHFAKRECLKPRGLYHVIEIVFFWKTVFMNNYWLSLSNYVNQYTVNLYHSSNQWECSEECLTFIEMPILCCLAIHLAMTMVLECNQCNPLDHLVVLVVLAVLCSGKYDNKPYYYRLLCKLNSPKNSSNKMHNCTERPRTNKTA